MKLSKITTVSHEMDNTMSLMSLIEQGFNFLIENEPSKFNEISKHIETCSNHCFNDLKNDVVKNMSELYWNIADCPFDSSDYKKSVTLWYNTLIDVCKNAIV